jgi:hypothetical protein
MKFSATLLSNVILASSALAGIAQPSERRATRVRQSRPNIRLSSSTDAKELGVTPNTTHVEYSSNWSGAVLTAPPAGSTFTSVAATFVVPTPSGTNGAASIWVGIDGDTYSDAILQTGVDVTVTNGKATYDCWYEWFPDYAYYFSTNKIVINAGDTIDLLVKSSSSRAGVVTITNKSTGKSVSQSLTPPTASAVLGGKNAEWIVEDFQSGNSLVPFANFGAVTFTGATAGTSSGASVDTTGASILDIEQNSKILTSVSASGGTVTVTYV